MTGHPAAVKALVPMRISVMREFYTEPGSIHHSLYSPAEIGRALSRGGLVNG
jgi:hypothetical protein